MDPKDLRKQLEQSVNKTVDERLENKGPKPPAPEAVPVQPSATPPAAQPVTAPTDVAPIPALEQATQTPADVAPSAPSAGAPTGTKGISINVAGNSLRSLDMEQIEIDQVVYDTLQSLSGKTNIVEIRSGGQSGVDEAAIKAAVELGIPAKVLAPKGWLFLDKSGYKSGEAEFKARFGDLVDRIEFSEHTVGDTAAVAYTSRNKANVEAADATLNFAEPEKGGAYSRGEIATRKWAAASGKPYVETLISQPDIDKIRAGLEGATSPATDQGVAQTPPPGETPASVAPTAISGDITSTSEAMNAGLRTSTTRAADWKVGDHLDFSQDGVKGFWRIREVKKYDFNDPAQVSEWESTEGWNFERIKKQGGKLLNQVLKPDSRTFILEKVDALPAGAKAIKQGMWYKYGPDGTTFDSSFTKFGGAAPEKMTTASTPDLAASMAATQTGELKTAPTSVLPDLQRQQSILGYDPFADLVASQGNKSKMKINIETRMLTDIIDYMKQGGIYSNEQARNVVATIKSGDVVYNEEDGTYEFATEDKLSDLLDDVNKAHANAMTEFYNKPHGLDRKVYDLYLKQIFGKEARPGKKVSATDYEADGATIERGRKAVRRLGLHFLLNRLTPEMEQDWQDKRESFKNILADSGVPEEVIDSAMRAKIYGINKDKRSSATDSTTVKTNLEILRRNAGELLREGSLYDTVGHPDVAQPFYYLLQEIVNSDSEILSGEMGNMNPFAEEEFIRAQAADLTEIADDIERLRGEFSIEDSPTNESGGAKGRSKPSTVGQEFTLRDVRSYRNGGQRRYVLDSAGVVDPRWIEVDDRGLDLEIFTNENHPDGTSTKASIGFNISTDPTARIYTGDVQGDRISTLEIRVTKAAKRFISERDFGSRLHPTSSDKTIRLAAEIPYTQDKYKVFTMAQKLRDAFSLGKVVLVAFPQFDQNGNRIPYAPGNEIIHNGRVFPKTSDEMFMLEEGDSAIAKLVGEKAFITKPFRFGDPVPYPSGQTKTGQYGMFVIDVDPIVHQAVRHELPIKSVGGYEFQGAYIPEPFADEFAPERAKKAIADTVQGVRQTQEGISRIPAVTTEMVPSAEQAPGMATEMVPQEVRVDRIVATPGENEVKTLIVADNKGNFPTIGTMVDGYVYGDPYGEDPRMYAEIAERTGPSLKSLISQKRKYEELIEAGTRSSEVPLEDIEKNTLLEGEISRQGKTYNRYQNVSVQNERNKNYNKFLEDKTYVDENPSDVSAMKSFDKKYKDTTWYKGIPETSEVNSIINNDITGSQPEGGRVVVYDATDVYDEASKTPRPRKATSKLQGSIVDLPMADPIELSPKRRVMVNDMLRSLLIILRHRAQTANFINFGDPTPQIATIRETSESLSKLFANLDGNGLYTRYMQSIIRDDVFSSRLGLDNPDAAVWMQKLVELPAQRPLSTRGRDTSRFLPRYQITGDAESDAFNDAVDAIYESVSDFHAQNPARFKSEISIEAMAEGLDAQSAAEQLTIEEVDPNSESFIDAAGNEITLSDSEKSVEFKLMDKLAKRSDKNTRLILRLMQNADVAEAIDGDIYKIAELRAPKSYIGDKPWGEFFMENIDGILSKLRNSSSLVGRKGVVETATSSAKTTSIKDAVKRLAYLPKQDLKRAVDVAFDKYSIHLADDMDGDGMVKVINSMLYGDQQAEALSKAIDDMSYVDVTEKLKVPVIPDLYGKEGRVVTNEEVMAISENKTAARQYIDFVKTSGYDFVATKDASGGTKIIITKVKKDKFGNIDIAPENTFSKRNVFTPEETTRVLENFGATGLIQVKSTGVTDGSKPLYSIEINPDALDYIQSVDARKVDERTGRLATTVRNLLDSSLKAEFRALVDEEARRSGLGGIFLPEEVNSIAIWEKGQKDGYFGPFGKRRDRGRTTSFAIRRGGYAEAERLARMSEYADGTKLGADAMLDALRSTGSAPKYEPLDKEIVGLSKTARSIMRNHKMGLIGGGSLLGAIAMGVGVDAALNKAQYGDQAAADYLPTSIAMNAAFEANPVLGSVLALSHTAVNKGDMARTLVNILGSLAGGVAAGAAGTLAAGPIGGFAAGTAGSMAGAGVTNALYNAVTGTSEDQIQQIPTNVAVDDGNRSGAGSVAAAVGPTVNRGESALDKIKQLQSMGG